MAQRTLVLSATNVYDYYIGSMSVGKIYIPSRDICEMSAPVSVSREFFCIRLPDAASILGTKALLKFEPTIRIQTSKPDFEKIIAFQTNAELPTIPTGSTSALDSSPGNLSFPPETPYISSNIPAPGLDYTLTPSSSATADTLSADTFNILKNKAILFGPKVSYPSDGVYFAYLTLLNGDAPKVTVYYDDAVDVKSQVYTYSQKSGYFNPRYDKRFSWDLKRDETETYFCVGGFTISSATFYWKESSAENWNSVSVSGENKNFVTIPANTFPAQSSIQWYVSATDQNGYTSQTAAYTLSTTDGTSTATPVFPINVTINGGIDNTFDWSVTNPTGEAHTRVVGLWSTAQTGPWSSLFDLSEDATSYTVPANTITQGGTIYWTVQSYNADGVAGPFSSPAVISVVAPPSAPVGVSASPVPFSEIAWQSTGQLAYEVLVDGIAVKKGYGAGIYSHELDEPLPDGEHTIGVRIQGSYGLWSLPGETSVTIANQRTATLSLEVRFDVDASLSWSRSPAGGNSDFRIYRDGVRIGHTNQNGFTDRLVLGEHEYFVIEKLSDGNYNRTASISGILKSCITRIAAAAGGEWLKLELSENSDSRQTFDWKRNVSLRHVAGAVYPVAEVSIYQDKTASYSCAFKDVAEARLFEALRGLPVIIKSRGGEVVIGILSQIAKATGDFFITYQFSVQQIHWEEYVDDTIS